MSSGPRPTSVPSSILIHPAVWPQQTWAENWRCAPFGGAGSPYNTMWPGAEAYRRAKWHLDPSNRLATIHQHHRQERQNRHITVRYHRANRFTNGRPKWLTCEWPKLQGIDNICILSVDHSNPSITNRLIVIAHTKPVIANCVPKLVAMTTSLITSAPPSKDVVPC